MNRIYVMYLLISINLSGAFDTMNNKFYEKQRLKFLN